MPPATPTRAAASVAALAGGSLWVLEWIVGSASALASPLHGVGLVLLPVATALAAAGLVAREVVALRLLVAAAAPALAWSVFEFFRPDAAGWYVGASGVVAVAAGARGLWRGRAAVVPGPRPTRGAHARGGSGRSGQPRGAHAR